MNVTKRDGSMEPLVKRKLARCVERACEGIADVSAATVIDEAYAQIFDGIKTTDLHRSAVLAAASRITGEPNYSYVAARLLMHNLYREAFGKSVDGRTFYRDYALAFQTNIKLLVDIGRFNPKMLHQFDLTRLAAALEPDRDLLLKYAGVYTIYDRYINHVDGRRLETPQAFFMRVAMGLCVNEDKPTDRAIAIYELISTLRYSPATPTLLNSGKTKAQMSSCYVMTMEDSIDGIYGTLHKAARLSKYGGGLGIDITPLRGPNAYIKGTNGRGNGLINWAKQYNDMVHSVNQGGSRKGAGCLYMEPWHLDYLDFLELRKATGDERRRCHDIDTSSWIPDEFMRRMLAGDSWYFFSPDDCPDLHETYGNEFSYRYAYYIQKAESGCLKNWQKMPAKDVWKKMLRALKETGHPWNTFKDPSNYRYANKHAGVIHSSQLCTEVLEHNKPTRYMDGEIVELGECAVCNLASINVGAYLVNGEMDFVSLAQDITVIVRGLDNVIDENFYPIPEAKLSNERYRFLGLGVMGWADLLHKLMLPFDSEEAIELADRLQEYISYCAIEASIYLAKERGAYPAYEGSEWSKGVLPIDSYKRFMQDHRSADRVNYSSWMDWESVRQVLAKYGIRNALLQAPAPTSTISTILGCSEGIGPVVRVIDLYQTISGNLLIFNEEFVKTLKARGLWNPQLVSALQKSEGDLSQLDLPVDVKAVFKTAYQIDQKALLQAAARRQKWIDQAQSLNIYYKGDSMKELSDIYVEAWELGLKTTYYLHGEAASSISKMTIVTNDANPTPAEADDDQLPLSSCAINGPCESCQ